LCDPLLLSRRVNENIENRRQHHSIRAGKKKPPRKETECRLGELLILFRGLNRRRLFNLARPRRKKLLSNWQNQSPLSINEGPQRGRPNLFNKLKKGVGPRKGKNQLPGTHVIGYIPRNLNWKWGGIETLRRGLRSLQTKLWDEKCLRKKSRVHGGPKKGSLQKRSALSLFNVGKVEGGCISAGREKKGELLANLKKEDYLDDKKKSWEKVLDVCHLKDLKDWRKEYYFATSKGRLPKRKRISKTPPKGWRIGGVKKEM